MGALQDDSTGHKHVLRARFLIGRHPSCDLCSTHHRVSAEHARVVWSGGSWEVRDLGSRNGTFVDGARIAPGEGVALASNAVLTLGPEGPAFRLVDTAPPEGAARHATTGRFRVASDGLLVLPDDETPLVSVYETAEGTWVVEDDTGVRAVEDGSTVEVSTELWTLDLPVLIAPTWEAAAAEPTLETITLRMAVSLDEEHVEVSVVHRGKVTPLPARTHHYMLVTLARARLDEHEAPLPSRGWLDREQLCRMLAVDLGRLNVDIYRARKQLAAVGVLGAAGLIERRATTGQIRIGTDQVEVVRLG